MVHSQSIVGSPCPLGLSAWFTWADEAQTARFAARLAACSQVRHAIVTLQGDLGAGKTTLVRHLLQALGVKGRIKSPTYAVVEPHEAPAPDAATPPLAVWHFDFYRFDDPREWEDAGFRDLFASPGLKLVEWPQKAGALLPAPDLVVHIHPLDDTRRQVQLVPHTPHGVAWIGALAARPDTTTEAAA